MKDRETSKLGATGSNPVGRATCLRLMPFQLLDLRLSPFLPFEPACVLGVAIYGRLLTNAPLKENAHARPVPGKWQAGNA